eukprot:TRINITY_DN17606_c0_g1_i1.p1 TRINITY_DN17606_c0_g1~~TRINITY_DN17606_c0_g1_i1.p1  ORF type:complete len:404 (+),score=66.03 TRINITY_DN17606_c0_g1_i1:66-1214(+)
MVVQPDQCTECLSAQALKQGDLMARAVTTDDSDDIVRSSTTSSSEQGSAPSDLSTFSPKVDLCLAGVASDTEAASTSNLTSLKFVRTLQSAPRNHGVVQQMELLGYGCVAVKRMPLSWTFQGHAQFVQQHEGELENPWTDVGIVQYLNAVGYPYVPEHIGILQTHLETFVISSLASEGDLFSWATRNLPSPGRQREESLLLIKRQVICALHALHDLGIAHGDVSAENILLTRDNHGELKVQIIDFAMASVKGQSIIGAISKESYRAPELYSGQPCDPFACDVFSMGVLMYCLSTARYPWMTTRPDGCKRFRFAAIHGFRALTEKVQLFGKQLSTVFSANFLDLLEAVLFIQPSHRATISDVMSSQWMQGLEKLQEVCMASVV